MFSYYYKVGVVIRQFANISVSLGALLKPFLLCLFVGVVSQLLLSSKTHNSLLLTWERPEYFTAGLRGLVYYEPLPQEQAGSEGMWLFVESDSDYLPPLEGLQELTNYSISMAVLDDTDRLCVFNEPLVAQTGNS